MYDTPQDYPLRCRECLSKDIEIIKNVSMPSHEYSRTLPEVYYDCKCRNCGKSGRWTGFIDYVSMKTCPRCRQEKLKKGQDLCPKCKTEIRKKRYDNDHY